MTTFEYKVLRSTTDDLSDDYEALGYEARLNELGGVGWDLSSSFVTPFGDVYVIFKRPKHADGERRFLVP
jgi:hypothetical protein